MVTSIAETDREILNHVFRYRLTLPSILAKTGIVSDDNPGVVQSTLERLVHDGWLRTADLYPGHRSEKYYHLSEKAALALDHDAIVARPLKADMRIESFAIATFCCCVQPFRELLTKQEFKEKFAQLWFTGQPTRYYLDKGEDGVVRLAFVKVDTGGPGQWDRLIDSCTRFLRQRTDESRVAAEHRSQTRRFAQLVERDQFRITVLTALPEKQRAIELELERRRLAEEVVPPMQVSIVPGLLEVISPAPGV